MSANVQSLIALAVIAYFYHSVKLDSPIGNINVQADNHAIDIRRHRHDGSQPLIHHGPNPHATNWPEVDEMHAHISHFI